jgi:ankyrin repeat protein
MKDIEDILFNEQWDKVIEEITRDKELIKTIDPADLAWKRFQYQLSENGIEKLVPPYGDYSDLLTLIDLCKVEGLLGLNIPQATAFQQLGQIKMLIDSGHSIDEQDFGERTGLLVAAGLNDLGLVKFMIENGAFVSFYDQDNFEAIDLTTSREIIELLRQHNGKTKEQRKKEYNEYCEARENLNVLREVNLLFMKGAETGNVGQMEAALKKSSMDFMTLNFSYPINGWTALHYAVKNNDKEVVSFLIKNGVDKGKKNLDGLTAIDLARQLGHEDLFIKS